MADNLELLRLRAKAKLKLAKEKESPSMIDRVKATPGAQFIPDDPKQEIVSGPPAEKTPGEAPSGFIEKAGRFALESLPAVGGVIGGIAGGTAAGSASLGVGAVPGGMIGATTGGALGASVKSIIEQAFGMDEAPESALEAGTDIAAGAIEGAAQQVGGMVLGPAGKLVGKGAKAVSSKMWDIAGNVVGRLAYAGATAAESVTYGWMRTVAAVIRSQAAMSSPKVIRKKLVPVEKAAKEVGKELADLYGKADKLLKPEAVPVASQVRSSIENTILTSEAQVPKSFFKSLRREMNDWFTESPGSKMSVSKLWEKAKAIEKASGKYSRATDVNSQSKKAILDSISFSLRDQANKLVSLVDDAALKSDLAAKQEVFKTLADGRRILRKQLSRATKKETIDAARREAARIVSAGPERLGKYYDKLMSVSGKGLGAIAAKHADLLNTDEEYAKIYMNMEMENERGE